jgi:hypothetical protein
MAFTTETKIAGYLFPVPKVDRVQGGPVMKGEFYVVGEHGKFEAAAWTKTAATGDNAGSDFLSFVLEPIGEDGRPYKVYGALYPSSDKRTDESSDYYGQLYLTNERGGATLRSAGWRRRTVDERKAAYISIAIGPPRQKSAGSVTTPGRDARSQQGGHLPL